MKFFFLRLFDTIIINSHWKNFHFGFVVRTNLKWHRKKKFSFVSWLFWTNFFFFLCLWICSNCHWKVKLLCMRPFCFFIMNLLKSYDHYIFVLNLLPFCMNIILVWCVECQLVWRFCKTITFFYKIQVQHKCIIVTI